MQSDFIFFSKVIVFFVLICGCVYSCASAMDKVAAATEAASGCAQDMPGYNKPWIGAGLTPCDWAGYECTDFNDCLKCNVAVANCEI